MSLVSFLEFFTEIPYLMTIIWVVIVVVVAVVLERFMTRYFRRFTKRRKLPPHVGNGMVLVSRLLILLGAVMALFRVAGLPTELLITFSALGGTAIGFASTRTLGNFVAGFYVLLTQPFRVRDYVRIGVTEGIVEEISLNYTKITTPSNTTVLISNQRVLDQEIVNYRQKGSRPPLYCYSFELGFTHVLPIAELEKTFDKVIEQYAEKLPRKSEYAMTKITSFARNYMFYLYIESPRDVFTLQPAFVRDITKAWDEAVARHAGKS